MRDELSRVRVPAEEGGKDLSPVRRVRDLKRVTRGVGDAFERRVEALLPGGRRTPASGATWGAKGDVAARFPPGRLSSLWTGMRVEAKATRTGSYTLTLDVLEKIGREAGARGELPVVAVELDGRGYAVLELEALSDLLNLLLGEDSVPNTGG